MSGDFRPGELVVVKAETLVRRVGSEEEHYTGRHQNAIVVQESHLWHEPGAGEDFGLRVDYLVLFSNDSRMYYVTSDRLMRPDEAVSAGRLFGRLPG